MKMNVRNYESYLLDYVEGRLNEQETLRLKAFCHEQGLDFEELVEDLPILRPDVPVFDKNSLLQEEIHPLGEIGEERYEEFFVAYHEGDLDEEEAGRVEAFVRQNAFLAADFHRLGLVKLKADKGIVYSNKDALKKGGFVSSLYVKVMSAAAVVALLFGLFWLPELKKAGPEPQPVLTESIPAETQEHERTEAGDELPAREAVPIVEAPSHDEQVAVVTTEKKHIVENPKEKSASKENPVKHEMLATLEPKRATEIRLSDDFAIENGLSPEMPLLLKEAYCFTQPDVRHYDVDEDYEIDRSLLSRVVQYLSEGRFETLGDVVGSFFDDAKLAVANFKDDVAANTYQQIDAQIESSKARWEEKRSSRGE